MKTWRTIPSLIDDERHPVRNHHQPLPDAVAGVDLAGRVAEQRKGNLCGREPRVRRFSSRLMPTTWAPAAAERVQGVRNAHASIVQPGV